MKKLIYLFVVTSIFLSSCSKESSQPMDITTAMSKINGYFQENLSDQIVILIGKEETLISDLSPVVIEDFNSQVYIDSLGGPSHPNNLRHTEIINHYYEGTPEFIALPEEIQEAVNVINDLKITGKLKDSVAVEHVIGTATILDIKILKIHGYGVPLEITPGATPTYMFMSDQCFSSIGSLIEDVTVVGITGSAAVLGSLVGVTAGCSFCCWELPPLLVACEISAFLADLALLSYGSYESYKHGIEVEQDCDL